MDLIFANNQDLTNLVSILLLNIFVVLFISKFIYLKFNNKSKRKLVLRVECYSEDNRWLLYPIKISPLELDPDDTGHLNINAQFDLKREPESTPECRVHIPFQTQSGQWLDINQQIKTFIKS